MVVRAMASQPSQKEPGIRAGRPVRSSEPIGGRRRLGLRPMVCGLVLVAAVVLGAWGYRAIRAESRNPGALWSQAQADLRYGRLDGAERALARLGSVRQPTPLDRMLRGQLALALGRSDQALAELARVPDSHDMAAQARLLAGQIERRRDRYRFAEEALREAICLDPKLVPAHRERIIIYGY
jgi:tetratricopeptide (TPR) repeat protein